jgi:Uma2 family endonuclease
MASVISPTTDTLRYEDYLREGYVEGRYDIVEGVRICMPGATWEHQRTAGNLYDHFRQYERASGKGLTLFAPFDVLIRRLPRLQTRQPDLLFISHEQLAWVGGVPTGGVLEVAPELVVEIISDSETAARIEAKIQDYIEIGVRECWRVWPETRIVEVLRLSADGVEIVATYGENDTVESLTFPDLTLSVADIFAL